MPLRHKMETWTSGSQRHSLRTQSFRALTKTRSRPVVVTENSSACKSCCLPYVPMMQPSHLGGLGIAKAIIPPTHATETRGSGHNAHVCAGVRAPKAEV